MPTASARFSYQWYRDGVAMAGETNAMTESVTQGSDVGSLDVTNVDVIRTTTR